ncbi:hypothetical protein [Burkholderia diffusa]|uniref:hypothetical protein n=1 Tax=Burkholderia diffusa TaxID=488732 RepID=UPI0012DA39FF|nr:hypothetical protein [Burkholderia diffusa]
MGPLRLVYASVRFEQSALPFFAQFVERRREMVMHEHILGTSHTQAGKLNAAAVIVVLEVANAVVFADWSASFVSATGHHCAEKRHRFQFESLAETTASECLRFDMHLVKFRVVRIHPRLVANVVSHRSDDRNRWIIAQMIPHSERLALRDDGIVV